MLANLSLAGREAWPNSILHHQLHRLNKRRNQAEVSLCSPSTRQQALRLFRIFGTEHNEFCPTSKDEEIGMFRRTAQWIAYFIIVIALVCGLEVIGNLPVQSQSSLPLGTHLWLVLWCALGLMIPIFVWFSRTYPPAFIVCTTAICTLDWLTLGLKYSHISPGGLSSGSTVDIVSNILNAISLIVLLFAWSRNDDK